MASHTKTAAVLPSAGHILMILVVSTVLSSCASEYNIVRQDSQQLTAFHQAEPYTVGYGDTLRILVWGDDKLSTETVVRPDGKISIPLVGDIQAEGLTINDLRAELTKRIRTYVKEPNISVSVGTIKSMKVYLIGEVARPGEQEMEGHMDVLQALSRAGGFTIYAKKTKIQIIRREGNRKIKIRFNYNQVIRGKNLNQNIPLKPGDVILVP